MQPTIIAIAAGKGGSAKSTLTWGLGSHLAKDSRVLLWDQDPQATLTQAIINTADEANAFDVLTRRITTAEALVPALPVYGKHLSIIPASPMLTGIEVALANDLDRQYALSEALEPVNHDLVLIDCPAGQGLLVTMALVAADVVVSPVMCSPPAFDALAGFAQTITLIQKRLNPRLRWLIIPSLFDQRNLLDREVLAALNAQYGDRVLAPPSRRRIAIPEDMAAQKPCRHQDFDLVAQTLLERIRS
ncbi:ParA family protein [Bdellovibrionota bacterium FG-1]